MKVLIIGFGSIGSRHFEILNSFECIKNIDVVSKQKLEHITCFERLNDVPDLNLYDYFVVATETSKHYTHLKDLCVNVSGKIILVEKPLYDKKHASINVNKNKIYTAYNLRFHPILIKIKELLQGEEVYYANMFCGQYLPSWRPNRDYRKSYSADIALGGGVLRDLSHELDYMCWLFGSVDNLQSINIKRSDLEITSDDLFTAIGVTSSKTIVNLTIDYMSKYPIRHLIIHTQNKTIEADVIQNSLRISDKSGALNFVELDPVARNDTYTAMHQAILSMHDAEVCSYRDGLRVVEMIDAVTMEIL